MQYVVLQKWKGHPKICKMPVKVQLKLKHENLQFFENRNRIYEKLLLNLSIFHR